VPSTLQFLREVRPHSVLDPIHGLVRLTALELSIINHPLFRRLRRIKQSGLLYLVFPSATHTRFEHSIGALHVVDSMLEQIWLNSAVARGKGAVAAFDSGRAEVAIDFSHAPPADLEWIVRTARLAALVHDLGHGPLSHTFDSFALFRDDLQTLLESGVVPSLRPLASALANWERRGVAGSVDYDRVPHEVMSCILFAHILESLAPSAAAGELGDLDRSLPAEICAAVLGEGLMGADELAERRREWLPFIHDLVASAPADADRMDYLERDSRSLGVTYGLFDRNRVLKSFLCFRRDQKGRVAYRLGVKRSGIPALENLVQARFELYVQVYHHKTNQAIALMLREIARRANQAKTRLFPVDQANTGDSWRAVVRRYQELGDDHFIRVLRGMDSNYPTLPVEAIQLAIAVDERQLWKRVYEGDEEGAAAVADALPKALDDETIRECIIHDVSKPNATKDLDKGATLLVRVEDGTYVPAERGWYEASIIIQALKEAEGNIGRVYIRGAALEMTRRKRIAAVARKMGRDHEVAHMATKQKERDLAIRVAREIAERVMNGQTQSQE
jgi:HD superfamily phosphohydrolase